VKNAGAVAQFTLMFAETRAGSDAATYDVASGCSAAVMNGHLKSHD